MITSLLEFERLIRKAYQKSFVNKVTPHLEKIHSLTEKYSKNYPVNKDVTNWKKNRVKYFDFEQRIKFIVNTLWQTFPKVILRDKPIKILDVGCGFGDYAAIFKHFGHEVIGINGGNWFTKDYEYVTDLLGIKVLYEEIIKIPMEFWKNEFNIIFCVDTLTLSHLKPFAKDICCKFLHWLKEPGKIIICNHHNRNLNFKMTIFEHHILHANNPAIKRKVT